MRWRGLLTRRGALQETGRRDLVAIFFHVDIQPNHIYGQHKGSTTSAPACIRTQLLESYPSTHGLMRLLPQMP